MKHFSSLIPNHLIQRTEQQKRIQLSLQQYLGHETAKHCQIARVSKNQVTIICDSAAWANRLRFQQRELIKLLQSEFGLPIIRVITKVGKLEAKRPATTPRTKETIRQKTIDHMKSSAHSMPDRELGEKLNALADTLSKRHPIKKN